MRASLADQPGAAAGLAISLGANLPGPAGDPLATLLALRPLLAERLRQWAGAAVGAPEPRLRWSPLFRTAPVGGPAFQPDYLNAVLLADWPEPADRLLSLPLLPSPAAALELLAVLQRLELAFGRQRLERWGPRSLDLDLLWCGALRCRSEALDLPHPRLLERVFVLAPLAAIDARLVPPGTEAPVATVLAQLQASDPGPAPVPLAGRHGWPE